MPGAEVWLAGVLLVALVLYFLLGGADFGGGVWDLFATGPRKAQQRALVSDAIAPVWEVNHVWLIFAVVLLFAAFPRAFAAITVALHIPLTLFLIGVVFRGSAFAFRAVDFHGDQRQRRWGRVFAWASLVSPVLLGMSVGALVSGRIRIAADGTVSGGFVAPWWAPFPLAVGLFALTLCAFLAAVYLAREAEEDLLREDFRRRALLSGVTVGVLALVALLLSREGAPQVWLALTARAWTWPFHALTGAAAVGAGIALWRRHYGTARVLAATQVALILLGWALSQYPWLVFPDLSLQQASGSPVTQRAMLWAIGLGAPVLVPSLWILFRVFKSERSVERSG